MVEDILRKIGISRRHWNYILSGERNASPRLALVIERELGIDKSVFVFGSNTKRKSEWIRASKRLVSK